MQILELLGSSAPTPAAINMGDVSSNDAFAKHLDEIIGQRKVIKAEDARRHDDDLSSGQEVADSETKPADDTDEVDEVAEDGADDKVEQAADTSESQTKPANNTETVATAAASGILAAVLAGAESVEAPSAAIVVDSELNETSIVTADLSDSPDASLLTVVADVAKPVAKKANEQAAFNGNTNDQASIAASDNASPFVADINKPVAEQVAEQVAMAANQAVSDAAVVDADFSEDATVAAEVVSLMAAPVIQSDAAKAQVKSKPTTVVEVQSAGQVQGSAASATVSETATVQSVAPTEVVADARLTVTVDSRLEAMRLAEAMQNKTNADNIFTRFAPGQSAAAPLVQVAAAQANTPQQNAAPALPTEGPAAESASKPISVAPQIPAAQSVQSTPNAQAAISAAVSAASGEMDDQVLNALTQTRPAPLAATAQVSAANVATAAATRGVETANASGPNNAPATAPVGAAAETATPNATQAAAAVRPATPPPSQPSPQVQVALQIAKAVQNGTDRISIRLHPAELGRIDVKLEVSQNGQVAATITVDRPETLELLKADSRALEQALADAGLEADRDDLKFNLRDRDENANQLAGDEDDGDGNPAANAEDDADQIALALAEARRNSAANRALDINV